MLSIDGGNKPGKNYIAVMGPMPVQVAGAAVEQMEEQGWRARFVLFAGMSEQKIAMMGRPSLVPVYTILAEKVSFDGNPPPPPEFNFGGAK